MIFKRKSKLISAIDSYKNSIILYEAAVINYESAIAIYENSIATTEKILMNALGLPERPNVPLSLLAESVAMKVKDLEEIILRNNNQ